MAHKAFSLLITVILLGISSTNVYAEDHHMRCGTKLISLGDTKAEVLLTCGQPLLKETIAIQQETQYLELRAKYPLLDKHGLFKQDGKTSIGSESSISLPIDQWTYNMGTGKFLRILIFQGGRLVAIEKGGRM